MQKVKKLFGEYDMTWKRVIILAVLTALYTAAVNVIPLLEDTSFTDIAVYLEAWFLFAVFIVVNCKKWWEAALKCFVFFLISQPLIYLFEVPFKSAGWGLFNYYGYWFKITLLTLPGAAIAFLIKKKNWLSVAVLSVATVFLACMSVTHFRTAFNNFPRHILSAVFDLALAVFFVFVILDDKKHRIVALAIILAAVIALSAYYGLRGKGSVAQIELGEGEWQSRIDNEKVITVEELSGGNALLKSHKNGAVLITFTNEKGEEKVFNIVVDGRNIMISPVD